MVLFQHHQLESLKPYLQGCRQTCLPLVELLLVGSAQSLPVVSMHLHLEIRLPLTDDL